MPVVVPIIAAVAAAAADAGVAAALAGTALGAALGATGIAIVSGLVGAIVSFAVGFIGNALLGSSTKSNNSSTAADTTNRTQQIRQPVAPHQIILGRVKVSGVLVYIYSNPSTLTGFSSVVKNGTAVDYKPNALLYTVVVIAGHTVAAINAITVDDVLATDSKFAGLAHVEAALGAPDQAANATFVAETQGEWTVNHRLQGRAALFSVFDYDQSAFSGVPNPAAIVDGAIPYDPRVSTARWCANPAILIAWYLTQDFGMRVAWEDIDKPSLIASANICDEQIPLLSGASEPRYLCCGTFTLDQAPNEVLDKLKACMDGGVVYSGGKWFIFAGATVAPSFTINQDMLRGPVTVQANRAAKDSFNAVRATYIRAEANWQATDAPVRYDEAAIAADGGTVFYQDFDFPFTTSGYTVQRLMQIALRRNRAERSITLQLNMAGLCVRPWDVVTFGTDRLPAANYRVTNWTLADTGVDLVLELEPDDIYAWNPATDELDLGTVATATLPGAYSLDAPVVQIGTPTAPVPANVTVAVEPVAGAQFADVQWRADGSSVWYQAPSGGFFGVTSPGGVASFRARSRADGQISTWTEDDPPTPPTFLFADGAMGGVSVTWETDAPSAQVFAGGAATYSDAALAYSGTAASTTVTSADGSGVYVWVRSVDATGNYSQPLGPVHAIAGVVGSGASIGAPGSGSTPPGGDGGGGEGGGGDGG